MKAIKVIEPFKVEIVDVPKPVIERKDDVIIRITSGGICGSDIGIYNGTNSQLRLAGRGSGPRPQQPSG